MLNLKDGTLWQWDIGRKIIITLDKGSTIDTVQFYNGIGDNAYPATAIEIVDDEILAGIPNSLLCYANNLTVYLMTTDEDGVKTQEQITLVVNKRAKPENYIFTDDEFHTYKVYDERLQYLEKNIVVPERLKESTDTEVKALVPEWARKATPDATLTKGGEAAEAAKVGTEIETLKKSVSSPYNYKGSVTYNELPTANNVINDTYYVTDKKCKYSWNGFAWYQSSMSEADYAEELLQLRTNIDGITQKNNTKNPLQPLMVDSFAFYKKSLNAEYLTPQTPQYELLNFKHYISLLSNESAPNTNGICARLLNPLPVFDSFNGEYLLIIKSDTSGQAVVGFSNMANWSSTATSIYTPIYIKKGLSIVPLGESGYTDNGHDTFNYFYLNAGSILNDFNDLEMYIVHGEVFANALLTEMRETSNEMSKTFARKDSFYHTSNGLSLSGNMNGVGEYGVNNNTVYVNYPEVTNSGNWHYGILNYYLGTKAEVLNKKLVLKANEIGLGWYLCGLGYTRGSWPQGAIPNALSGNYEYVNLKEVIESTPTLNELPDTQNIYFMMCTNFGNIKANEDGSYTSPETSVSFEVLETSRDNLIVADMMANFNPDEYVKKSDKYVVCWGDSLTAGGGWTSTLQNLCGMEVCNAGTGGEGVATIVARQGADVMMVNDITIPASTTAVHIANYGEWIPTEFGTKAAPLLQGGAHVNPVKIGDIEGTLKWTGSSYNDATGEWTFTRSVEGEEVVIKRPTAMRTNFDRTRNAPYLMVIFMGQNGGYSSFDDLVQKHRLMIEHADAKHVVILGLSSGSAESRAEYETTMRTAFGRYFISLRDYLSKYGLDDAGLTPTEEDLAAMETGTVPPQLLSDGIHYTSACKTVIGNMLYKKCCDLGIFE